MEENMILIDEASIKDRIYTIRGVKVMLDYDLAEIYGYSTGAFNRQVKNNAEKFEGDDFMFQITGGELSELVKCKNYISRKANMFTATMFPDSSMYFVTLPLFSNVGK